MGGVLALVLAVANVIVLVNLFQYVGGAVDLYLVVLVLADVELPEVVALGEDQTAQLVEGAQRPDVHAAVEGTGREGFFLLDHRDAAHHAAVALDQSNLVDVVLRKSQVFILAGRRALGQKRRVLLPRLRFYKTLF